VLETDRRDVYQTEELAGQQATMPRDHV
jgi:hypothetical protein